MGFFRLQAALLYCVLFVSSPATSNSQTPSGSTTISPNRVTQVWGDKALRVYLERRSPCIAGDSCTRHALIFIHGLMGSSETWKYGQTYWPALIASDKAVDDFDIYRIDYETGILTGASMYEVRGSLAGAMNAVPAMKSYETIQFIAHSLGGNIVRDHLVYLKTQWGHGALNQFRQMVLIGSPGEGSYLATITKLATNNPQLRILVPHNKNDYLGLLNDTWRAMILKRGRARCPTLSTMIAYEELPVPLMGIIVSKESATSSARDLSLLGHTNIRGFKRNHIDIVKPTGVDDPVYQWVKQGVVDCAEGHAGGPCPRVQELPAFCRKL